MTFEPQLESVIFFHLEEHTSGRHLLQVLAEDDWARKEIAPPEGIKKSSDFEAINTRGFEQLIYIYQRLVTQPAQALPKEHAAWGDLVAIDISLDRRRALHGLGRLPPGCQKGKVHVGFDLKYFIPGKIFLTDGKGDERPLVNQILSPGQTGVMDRYYQCHKNFDLWQEAEKHFVCRIKAGTGKTCLKVNHVPEGSSVFSDAVVLLGTPHQDQTQRELRVVGYRVGSVAYWVATDRHDLSAEDIAMIDKLRWEIEIFFGWWKSHLKVYHLIARSRYGLMVQILGGLITYLTFSHLLP